MSRRLTLTVDLAKPASGIVRCYPGTNEANPGVFSIIPLDDSRYNVYIGFVSSKLAEEIGQSKPFALLEEEALLNLVRTHEFLQQRQAEFFKPFGLTGTQYNILRILRGAGGEGVTCSQAAERMVAADPDITRLLDRLEARQLIRRERGREDRRVVLSYITAEGLQLLKSIDKPLLGFLRGLAGHIERRKLQQFIETLEAIRKA
jgi:DNA-binding MarR family transcriptional regulator